MQNQHRKKAIRNHLNPSNVLDSEFKPISSKMEAESFVWKSFSKLIGSALALTVIDPVVHEYIHLFTAKMLGADARISKLSFTDIFNTYFIEGFQNFFSGDFVDKSGESLASVRLLSDISSGPLAAVKLAPGIVYSAFLPLIWKGFLDDCRQLTTAIDEEGWLSDFTRDVATGFIFNTISRIIFTLPPIAYFLSDLMVGASGVGDYRSSAELIFGNTSDLSIFLTGILFLGGTAIAAKYGMDNYKKVRDMVSPYITGLAKNTKS